MEVVGSNLAVKPEAIKRRIESFIVAIEQHPKATADEIESLHNLYTCYVVLFLQHGSGHRPVIDPFCDPGNFDLENGFVIIEDKVVSAAHESRLSWLSDEEIKQIRLYAAHLDNLARKIKDAISWPSPDPAVLAGHLKHISEILNGHATGAVGTGPCFFLLKSGKLKSLTPSSIEAIVGSNWNYLLNQNRHLLESGLMASNVPSGLVDAQMGHITSGSHPYGISSVNSPRDLGEIIRSAISNHILQMGWKAIPGYKTSPAIQPAITRKTVRLPWTPGPIARELTRKSKATEIKNLLERECMELFASSNINLEPGQIQKIQAELEEKIYDKLASYPDEMRIALSSLHGYVHKAYNHAKAEFKYNLVLDYEPSPFRGDWLHNFKEAKRVRGELARYFDACSHKKNPELKVTAEIKRAELIFAAAFVGGLFNPKWLTQLAIRESKCSRIGRLVFMEFEQPASFNKEKIILEWRWFLDPACQAILYTIESNNFLKVNVGELENELIALGKLLGLKLSGRLAGICLQLSDYASSYWKFYLPGYLFAIMDGKQKTRCLPSDTLWRIFNQKCVPLEKKADVNSLSLDNSIRKKEIRDYLIIERVNIVTNKKFKSDLLGIINKVISGNESGVNRRSAPAKLKSLSNYIENYLAHENTNLHGSEGKKKIKENIEIEKVQKFSDLSIIVANWVLKMCHKGARRAKYLEPSSIRTYLHTVFDPLSIAAEGREDLLKYESNDFEDLYMEALRVYQSEDKGVLFERLIYFHQFVESYYGVDDVDWNEIGSEFNIGNFDHGKAEIVTNSEYWHILEELKSFEENNDHILFVAASIILGFRFGLRIGEVYRLRYCDFERHGANEVFVQVENTIEGKTKSFAGRRSVPLFGGEFNANENYFINKLLNRLESIPGFDIRCPLFSDKSGSKHGITWAKLSSLVHRALKQSTKRYNISFHTLRHTWLSRTWLEIYGNSENQPELVSLINKLTLNSVSSKSLMDVAGEEVFFNADALSEAIGHERCSTTIECYLHIGDLNYAGVISQHHFHEISVDGMEYLLDKKSGATQSYRKKLGIRSHEVNRFLSSYKSRLAGEEVVIVESAFGSMHSLGNDKGNRKLSLSELDQLFKYYALRNRNPIHFEKIFNLPFEGIEYYLELARKIENASGYYRFSVNDTADQSIYMNVTDPDVGSFGRHSQTLSELHTMLERKLDSINQTDKNLLNAGLEQWIKSHVSYQDVDLMVINEPDELMDILALLKIMGFDRAQFEIRYPNDFPPAELIKLQAYWGHGGISSLSKSKWNSSILGSRKLNRYGVSLHCRDLKGIGIDINAKQLARLFFVMAVSSKI